MIKLKKTVFYGKMHKGAEMLHEAQLFLTKVQQSAFYSVTPHATHPYCGQIFLRKIFGGKYIYIYISNSAREIATKCLGVCVCVTKSFFSKLFVKSFFATFLLRLFIKSRPKIFKRYFVSLL